MIDTDRLAALLRPMVLSALTNYAPLVNHDGYLHVEGTTNWLTDILAHDLISAGVTLAPPAGLDEERLAAALHDTATRNHNLGEGPLRAICPDPSWHNQRAAAIAAAYGPAPDPDAAARRKVLETVFNAEVVWHGYTCDLCEWGRDGLAPTVEEYARHLRREHCGPAPDTLPDTEVKR